MFTTPMAFSREPVKPSPSVRYRARRNILPRKKETNGMRRMWGGEVNNQSVSWSGTGYERERGGREQSIGQTSRRQAGET